MRIASTVTVRPVNGSAIYSRNTLFLKGIGAPRLNSVRTRSNVLGVRPSMPNKIVLDHPKGDLVASPLATVLGWCTTLAAATELTMRVNGRAVPFATVDRHDVRRVFPDVHSFGFTHTLALETCLDLARQELQLEFELGEVRLARSLRFSEAPRADRGISSAYRSSHSMASLT